MQPILIIILLTTSLFAREDIAVIDFDVINISEGDAKGLTYRLSTEMIALNWRTVERTEMNRLLDEQKFQYSGCADIKCAVEIGKMLGTKYMVVGTINKVGKRFTVDSRLINVETSEVYANGQYTSDSNIDDVFKYGMKSIAYQLSGLEQPELLNQSESFFSKIYKQRKIIGIVWFVLWIGWGLLPA